MRSIRGKKYLTIDEVAEYIDCSTTQLANWRSKYYETDQLQGPKFVKLGRDVLYSQEEVDSYLDEAGF